MLNSLPLNKRPQQKLRTSHNQSTCVVKQYNMDALLTYQGMLGYLTIFSNRRYFRCHKQPSQQFVVTEFNMRAYVFDAW